jgi:hypothetical protein
MLYCMIVSDILYNFISFWVILFFINLTYY